MSRRAAARPAGPVPPDLQPAIVRLRQLAAQAAEAGTVAEAAPHPDAELLLACGQVLMRTRLLQQLWRDAYADAATTSRPLTPAEIEAWADMDCLHREQARLASRRAGKLPAATGAGIYAKALCVAYSATSTSGLAKSLAQDLMRNAALRRCLWPAADGG